LRTYGSGHAVATSALSASHYYSSHTHTHTHILNF
jgi:hypothetical protein